MIEKDLDLLQLLGNVQEPQQGAIVCFVHGLSDRFSSMAELKPIMTLDYVIKHANKVEKKAMVRNKHYTLSHNHVTFLNSIGVSEGEVWSYSKNETY
ncbi:hypothetical protein ABTD45_19455 [Acinetobacter baumannii]